MRNVFGWAVMGGLVCSSAVMGQQTRPGVPNVRPGTQPAAGVQVQVNQQHHSADQQIAQMIVACNRNEVEISKFAMSKLKSDEAKEVATMLIKDHTEAANKFSKWAGQPANVEKRVTEENQGETRREGDRREEGRREGRREEGRRDNEQTRTAPATSPNNPGATPRVTLKPVAGNLDWAALHQEFADEGLASCKKELSRYEGNEFDKAFLGHQIGGHLMAATNLRVLKRHASSELGTEIDEAIEATESHLKKIRDLMEDKKDESNK